MASATTPSTSIRSRTGDMLRARAVSSPAASTSSRGAGSSAPVAAAVTSAVVPTDDQPAELSEPSSQNSTVRAPSWLSEAKIRKLVAAENR
jgi:hypothetical protein